MSAEPSLRRRETFRTAMRQNGAEYDEYDAADAFDARPGSEQGLDFTQFCAMVRSREEGEQTDQELRARFHQLDLTGSGRVEKHEYLRFALKDALARSVTRVQQLFYAWDEDGSGTVSVHEFKLAVFALGFSDVSSRQIEQIFAELDEDGSGELSYHELDRKLRKFAGIEVQQRHELRRTAGGRRGAALSSSVQLDRSGGKDVAELLREALAANAVRVLDLFRDWDEDGSGLIDRDEFFKAMPTLGIHVSRPEADELFAAFDADGSGNIEYRELDKLLRRKPGQTRRKRAAPSMFARLMPPGPSAGRNGAALDPNSPLILPSPREALMVQQGLVAEPQSRAGIQYNPTRPEYTGLLPPNPWMRPPELNTLAALWLQPSFGQSWRTQSHIDGLSRSPRLSPRGQLPQRFKPSASTRLDALDVDNGPWRPF
jgi:Ca2+-binding EF-hand superfamily protein